MGEVGGAQLGGTPPCLEQIFACLTLSDRLNTLPLVCREFHAVLSRPGLHWQLVELDGWLVAPSYAGHAAEFWDWLLRWLGPRGPSVRRLTITNLRANVQLPAAEQAAVMRKLLSALPALQHLTVTHSASTLSPEVRWWVGSLGALRRLRVEVQGPLPTKHLDALAALPLQQLCVTLVRRLDGTSRFEGPFPSRLTCLTGLERLVLEGPYSSQSSTPSELPDGIANWKKVTHLCLVNLGLEVLPSAIGDLAALQELCLGRNMLGACSTSLPDSITKLTRLRRLELNYNLLGAGPPPIIGHLTALEELNLAGNHWGEQVGDLPPTLSRLGQLRYLTLTNCKLRALPPVVAGMGSLHLLKVNINSLQDLPAGPYLASIKMVDLAHNNFLGYPAALLSAPNLHAISFQHNGVHYSLPELAAAAVTGAAGPPAILLAAAASGALALVPAAGEGLPGGLPPLALQQLEVVGGEVEGAVAGGAAAPAEAALA